jgi:pyruvyl transferase EpsO
MKAAMNITKDIPLKLNHDHLMRGLIAQHDFLLDLIGHKDFIFIDMPVYGNIGDLLIMQGTFRFFENNKLKPRIVAPIFAFDINWIKPDDVIVFQGGGNFGDLYAGMQPLREKVAKEKPNNRIIVLPQTIHFSSEAAMQKSIEVFKQHPDFHLCVRDEHSYALAKQFTEHAYLAPDMAHHLYPIKSIPSIPHATLLLSRTDDEKSSNAPDSSEFTTVTDWPKLVGNREKNFRLFYLAMRAFYRSGFGKLGNKLFAKLWPMYAQTLIQDASQLFGRHEYIVTDRLHGHILACLMSKPHTVLDNSYGKNSGYSEVWTAASEIVSQSKV